MEMDVSKEIKRADVAFAVWIDPSDPVAVEGGECILTIKGELLL